jgi:hypothetical protein
LLFSLYYTSHSNSQKETLRIVCSLIVANDLKYFQCEFWNILTSHRWSNNPIVLKEFTALSRVNENTSACKTIHFFLISAISIFLPFVSRSFITFRSARNISCQRNYVLSWRARKLWDQFNLKYTFHSLSSQEADYEHDLMWNIITFWPIKFRFDYFHFDCNTILFSVSMNETFSKLSSSTLSLFKLFCYLHLHSISLQ